MALSDAKREQVKALLAMGKSKNEIAKEVKISWETVDRISKEEPDKIETFREQKRNETIEKIWANIEDAIELGHSMVKEAKQGKRDIPLSHISTYVGTLYDKQALMQGDPTQNVSGGMVIHIGIPDTAEADE